MRITIVGIGYVGLSNAVLLAQHNHVTALDKDRHKVELITDKISPISDSEISYFLKHKNLNLTATTDKVTALKHSDYIIIATPTDYDPTTNFFNTESVESVINDVIAINPRATIVIKSTVPVGFTQRIAKKLNSQNIIFSPEFLREGKALYDNLYPTRIIIGEDSERAKKLAYLLKVHKKNTLRYSLLSQPRRIKAKGITVIIYEPSLKDELFFNFKVIKSLYELKTMAGLVISNRMDAELNDIASKVYTRDLFGSD